MTREAGERTFDELAIGLSNGSLSRGKALRLMGTAIIGGVLASIPGIAEAAPPRKPAGRIPSAPVLLRVSCRAPQVRPRRKLTF